jgi:hypothetical protein
MEEEYCSIAHQLFSLKLDEQIKNLLLTLFSKALATTDSSWFEIWRNEIQFGIDFLYSALSLQSDFLISLFKSKLEPEAGTLGMSVLGLTWERKGSCIIFLCGLLSKYLLEKLRQISTSGGKTYIDSYDGNININYSFLGWKDSPVSYYLQLVFYQNKNSNISLRKHGKRLPLI